MNNKKSPLRERAESRIRRGKIGLEELSGAEMEELLQELQVHQVELEMQNEELKRTQDSLESSRDRYAALYHAAPIGFCSLDNLGHVIEMNHTFITILEVSKEALVNRTLLKHIHEEDLGIYFHLMKQKEHHSQTRLRMYTVDKQVRVVDMTSVRIGFDQEERLLLAEDVTEAQKRELELNKRSNVLDQTMDGVVITDSGNRVSYVNPAFEKTTGYCREDVVGRNPSILSSSQHDKRFYMEMWKHIKQKGHWRGEIWNKRKNGEIYPELLTVTAIKNDYGQLESYVGVF